MLRMFKKRIACCIVNSAQVVVEFRLLEAPCLYLSKKLLIVFLHYSSTF